jgi:hypothetical protein
VIYTVVTLMLNPFFYNLRKRTSKVLWKHWESIKLPIILGQK